MKGRRRTEETKDQRHRRDMDETTDPEIASKVADVVTWNNGGGQSPKWSVTSGRRGTKEIKGAATVEGNKQDQSPNWRTKSKVDGREKLGQVREEELDE